MLLGLAWRRASTAQAGAAICACCSRTARSVRSGRRKWLKARASRCWALDVQERSNHNKATCALANKLARTRYATLRDHKPFDEAARLIRKENRQSFAMPN